MSTGALSTIEVDIRTRVTDSSSKNFADIKIDGRSLFDLFKSRDFDVIACLGWGTAQYRTAEIYRLVLEEPSDMQGNRNSIYVCPDCGDLGCGAISVDMQVEDNKIVWKNFKWEGDYGGITEHSSRLADLGPIYFDFGQYCDVVKGTYFL
ncbi:hypothetical protein [Paenibacillus sp. MMS18-CY102]|uniref:hypothetical protein n=1 Tax=Paenibacillus sp. MMS18-CY102 TaxID=2682849 RepID=UPI001365B4BA|nr:hypothetical protein [Paenibacillus sp. MMS18-CY102]MWC31172.1 hypothetical protein [Paenibacillus sp. MMS18-CY102]